MRPPPLEHIDSDVIRSDLKSEDVRRVHPDLPVTTSTDRHRHLKECDMLAYDRIRDSYPDLLPPWVGGNGRKGTPSSSSSSSSTSEVRGRPL